MLSLHSSQVEFPNAHVALKANLKHFILLGIFCMLIFSLVLICKAHCVLFRIGWSSSSKYIHKPLELYQLFNISHTLIMFCVRRCHKLGQRNGLVYMTAPMFLCHVGKGVSVK